MDLVQLWIWLSYVLAQIWLLLSFGFSSGFACTQKWLLLIYGFGLETALAMQ